MTSIKPPDGRSSAVPPAGAGEAGGPERASGPSFRDALERAGGAPQAEGTSPAATEASAGSRAADPVSELARAVQSGALSADQAIERLVERAVAAVGGQLSPAQRSELTAVLHEALRSDPALRELRDAVK